MPEERPEPRFPEVDDGGTVDLAQIDYNLRLTPVQRLDQLDNWIRFIRAAHRAFRERHGFDPADTDAPE